MTTLGRKHLLHIDIETYSSNDIGFGVYKYSEADDFEIQLVSYALDNEPVHCVDLACGEEMPVWLRKALTDPNYQKIAHNASFERVCFSRWLGMDGFLDPAQWRCTMVMALMAGLPASLKQVGEALDLEVQKDARGTVLINYFAKPCTPTKSNGMRTRNLPKHDPDKWAIYKEYNVRDVETEVEIYKALAKHPQPEWVWEQWFTDQRINDRGIKVDLDLVNAVRAYNEVHQEETLSRLKELTGIANPKSVQQVSAWLEEQGIIPDNLRSATVDSILKEIDGRPEFEVVAEALKLRSEASPTSVKKYDMAYNATGKDGRVRGSFQFYGAARTGRYSGRLVQLQNLKRNEYPELNEMRELIKAGQSKVLDSIYPSLSEIYGQLVRTMFIPTEHTFTVCDYSAIEARIQAWLAQETWVLEAFAAGKDIYCETASQMFGVPVEKHGVNGHLRQRGKVSVLACGYAGGAGAMAAMDIGHKIDPEEYPTLIKKWRSANSHIVEYWSTVGDAFASAINGNDVTIYPGIRFWRDGEWVFITLPSGRHLSYYKPQMKGDGWKQEMSYMSLETGKWVRVRTHKGKVFENICQAIGRDALAAAIDRLEANGFPVVMHVHDEVIVDRDCSVEDVQRIMSEELPWAKGLALPAAGYNCPYYIKD